jgi:CRP-like cAMP-binding protein
MEGEIISVSKSPRRHIFLNRRSSMGNKDTYINSKRMAIDLDESPEGLLELFNTYFKKQRRSVHDAQVIQTYLSHMNEFIDMLKKVEDAPISGLLQTISMHIAYEFIVGNRLLFKTGDTGNKFYILLKGRVDILGAQPIKIGMNEKEYITYLGRLRLYGENDLLQKTIQVNRMIYPIESDDFDTFIRKTRKLSIAMNDPEVIKFRSTLSRTSLNILLSKEVQTIASLVSNSPDPEPLEKITTEEYIERVNPKINISDQSPRYLVSVYEYIYKLSLTTGNKFGDAALNDVLSKRTASIITCEDTHLGAIYKEIYDLCIKSVYEKVRAVNLSILNHCDIFRSITSHSFSKKYYSNFVSLKVLRGDKLIEEGSEFKCYYFVKEGEYDIFTQRSIAELTELIKRLGGNLNDHEERHLCLSNNTFNKYYNEKAKLRVYIIKENEVLGFDDYVHNNRYNFTVELMSAKSEVFKLDKKIFNIIRHAEPSVMVNTNKYVFMKKAYILRRLMKIRDTVLNSIHSRINKKKTKVDDKFILRPNTALLVPRKVNDTPVKRKGFYPKRDLFFKDLYEQRLFKRSIERPDEEIENTLVKVDQMLNSARETERPSSLKKSTKNTISLFDKPIKRLNLEECRCSSTKTLVKKDIGEVKENEKRMYLIRQKYNMKRRNKSDSSLGTQVKNSCMITLLETPRVMSYQFFKVDEGSDNQPQRMYLKKINMLFHNRAKIFNPKFLVKEGNVKQKLRKTQSAKILLKK